MKTEVQINRKKIYSFINLLLGLWMTALFLLQIVLYPPPPMLHFITELNLIEPFIAMQGKVLPFFQTTDLNMDFALKFND